jgi:hypothetical protein
MLAARRSLPGYAATGARWMGLAGMVLVLALLAAGTLPAFTYPLVIGFLSLTVLVTVGLSLLVRAPGPLGPFLFIGAVSLGLVVLDAAIGGLALRLPLLGGTAFDGARFYGLPNAFLALALASGVFLAHPLEPFSGFALLFGVGLFVGFPGLGADLGGAATVFVGAGLWWVLRTRRGFDLRDLAFVAGVALLGLALVLLANRFSPGTPTHVDRFLGESEAGGVRAVVEAVRRRLEIGFGQLTGQPAALIPLVGLPVVLGLAIHAPGPIGRGFVLDPAWRHVVIVVAAASIVAYFLNDTGVAAAAPGFLYSFAALAYPALLASEADRPRRHPPSHARSAS